jgi:hypothetical protein
MRSRLLVVTFGGALLATALALACSTSDDGGGSALIVACRETFTMCSLDPMPSLAQTQACTTALDGPCGNAGLVYRSCVTGLCTDAGFTDYGTIDSRCYNDQVSFQDCLDALDAGATSTSGDDDVGEDEDASVRTTPTPTATGTTNPPTPDASSSVDAGTTADSASPLDATATDAGDGSL